jgi:diguanylate cyclase (GGDEF)-like protein/PAS domain S-box-containing protein
MALMKDRAQSFSRLDAKRREQTPQALARLVVVTLFVGLWFVLWLARIPMPLPFLIALLIEILFFVAYWRVVFFLPTVRAVTAAQYVMLGAEILFHTTMVYFLGSLSWLGPFAYVFGLIFTNAFLDLRRGMIYTAGACTAFTTLILLEATGTVPHYVYLDQNALRYTDAQFVATTLVGAIGVFVSIYLWSSWVGHQLRRERDAAVRAQDDLLEARVQLLRVNEELEERVHARTADLETANVALSESQQQLRLVLETCPDLISIQEPTALYRFLNAAWKTVLGYEPSDLVGQSPAELVHPDDLEDVRERFRTMVSLQQPAEATFRFRHAGGHWVTLEANGQVLVDQAGQVTGVVVAHRDVTERKRAEDALRESEERYRWLIESASDAMVIANSEGDILMVNTETEKLFGYRRDELLGKPVELLIPERLRKAHAGDRAAYLAGPERRTMGTDRGGLAGRRKDGSEFSAEISLSPLETDEGMLVTATIRDITERKRAEDALRESEATLKVTIESTADGILVIHPERRVAYANRRFIEMWHLPEELAIAGNDSNDLVTHVLDQLQDPDEFLAMVEKIRRTSGEWRDTLQCKDGSVIELYARAMLKDEQIVGRVVSCRDVTERIRAEEALTAQARRDPLTGLLNRRAGLSAVEERLAYAKETRRPLAVLILDLDRFKLINDRYSHETGDAALIRFSHVMTKLVGERGVVCRLGGDEFEIALDGVGLADAVRFAERLRTSLRRSLKQEQAERLPPFTASTGIACYPEDGRSSADLARRADEAMYAAKAGGADAVCVWRELGNRQVA